MGSASSGTRFHLFLVSFMLLFLELACIRWFPAHVMMLTFFTNIVLLACFLGMSLGCLAARKPTRFLQATPYLLAFSMAGARSLELWLRKHLKIDLGGLQSPNAVFFGSDWSPADVAKFEIPAEVLGGVFFLIIALMFVGVGQELGRALNAMPNRIEAYTINILGSLMGIVIFSACSWFQVPPVGWFVPLAAYFVWTLHGSGSDVARVLALGLVLFLASTSYWCQRVEPPLEEFWSPYYRVNYADMGKPGDPIPNISVNQIGHQTMASGTKQALAYSVPHLLQRDSGGAPFKDVLIIGAGSGNDVSRTLKFGAEHIDAVEIDPVIHHLGYCTIPTVPIRTNG